ncbi:hypothetical protein V6Z11_D10G092900 [Gossypium hirsutum]
MIKKKEQVADKLFVTFCFASKASSAAFILATESSSSSLLKKTKNLLLNNLELNNLTQISKNTTNLKMKSTKPRINKDIEKASSPAIFWKPACSNLLAAAVDLHILKRSSVPSMITHIEAKMKIRASK